MRAEKMAIERIYIVKEIEGQKSCRLIMAENKAKALSYAVSTSLKVEIASQKDLVELVMDGVAVETVTDEAGETITDEAGETITDEAGEV